MNVRPVTLMVNGKERQVGSIVNDYMYLTVRKASIHFYKKHNGWAISQAILDILETLQIDDIGIMDKESGRLYRTSFTDFVNHGKTIYTRHDKQIVLPVKFMEVVNAY